MGHTQHLDRDRGQVDLGTAMWPDSGLFLFILGYRFNRIQKMDPCFLLVMYTAQIIAYTVERLVPSGLCCNGVNWYSPRGAEVSAAKQLHKSRSRDRMLVRFITCRGRDGLKSQGLF